jgi:hypothetical protein
MKIESVIVAVETFGQNVTGCHARLRAAETLNSISGGRSNAHSLIWRSLNLRHIVTPCIDDA